MNSYMINFATYAFAMIGFILTIFFIYKKSTNISSGQNKKNFLQVENSLRISPVKTIYVIKAGSEKFLINHKYQDKMLLHIFQSTLLMENSCHFQYNSDV